MKLSQTNEKFDSGCSPLKQNYKKVQPEPTHQNRKNEGEKISTFYFTSTLYEMGHFTHMERSYVRTLAKTADQEVLYNNKIKKKLFSTECSEEQNGT